MGRVPYDSLAKVSIEMQQYILNRSNEGFDCKTIAIDTAMHLSTIKKLVKRGTVQRKRCKEYKCPGCGAKVKDDPCLACEMTKRVELQKKSKKNALTRHGV